MKPDALNCDFKPGIRHSRVLAVASQSVKTASGGEVISFDSGKKVKGRKRPILIDTMGLLPFACVHGGGRSDHGGMTCHHGQFWTCVQLIWVNSTFAGKDFIAKIAQQFGWTLECVCGQILQDTARLMQIFQDYPYHLDSA